LCRHTFDVIYFRTRHHVFSEEIDDEGFVVTSPGVSLTPGLP
jgi:hypothetical protein